MNAVKGLQLTLAKWQPEAIAAWAALFCLSSVTWSDANVWLDTTQTPLSLASYIPLPWTNSTSLPWTNSTSLPWASSTPLQWTNSISLSRPNFTPLPWERSSLLLCHGRFETHKTAGKFLHMNTMVGRGLLSALITVHRSQVMLTIAHGHHGQLRAALSADYGISLAGADNTPYDVSRCLVTGDAAVFGWVLGKSAGRWVDTVTLPGGGGKRLQHSVARGVGDATLNYSRS